jgi:hypothetical protein
MAKISGGKTWQFVAAKFHFYAAVAVHRIGQPIQAKPCPANRINETNPFTSFEEWCA